MVHNLCPTHDTMTAPFLMMPLTVLPAVGPARMFDVGDFLSVDIATMSPLAWGSVLVLVAYLASVITLIRKGERWGFGATLSFVMGCAAWFVVTGTATHTHADTLVSALIFQQLTLMVVAPPLLLLGSPGRLLLKATPHRGLGRWVLRAALGAYRSRAAYVLLHPLVVVIVPLILFPALYLTDAVSLVLAVPGGHSFLLTVFLVFGTIAAAPLWARDPMPRTPSYAVRLVEVFVEIQIHAIFGLMLILGDGTMFSWFAGDPVGWDLTRAADESIGGTLAWSYGELPLIIVLAVTLSKWRNRDMKTASRRQDEEDAALDEYNAYLAAQAQAGRRQS